MVFCIPPGLLFAGSVGYAPLLSPSLRTINNLLSCSCFPPTVRNPPCSSPRRGDRERDRDRDRDRDRGRDRDQERDKGKDKAKAKAANGSAAGGGLDLLSKLAAINARVVGKPAVAVS